MRSIDVLRPPWLRLLVAALAGSSIASLLLYFFGTLGLREGVVALLLPAAGLLVVVLWWARRTGQREIHSRITSGLWAGAVATLAYDVVRVPLALSGVPVFKAISYFGSVIADVTVATPMSELLGWAYHLSNGVGFALVYTALIARPRWWTALAWGLLLEAAMLATPYAEIFGYQISARFLAVTVGAHAVYGLTLWLALRAWLGGADFGSQARLTTRVRVALLVVVAVGIGGIAADFHSRHSEALGPSPPAYLGPHLYTTWSILEPDRICSLWILSRFVEPEARFYFVEDFSRIDHGVAFDIPDAEVRRSGARSATEVLIARHGLEGDERLTVLARVTHLFEITPWMRLADPEAESLGREIVAAAGDCVPPNIGRCMESSFDYLDAWYAELGAPH